MPYHDGGSQVTGYLIEKKERNTILWVRENKIPCLECHYKVSNLIEGLEYQFRVYAMNIAGLSKASEPSRPALALNPVGKFFCCFPLSFLFMTSRFKVLYYLSHTQSYRV